LSWNDRFPILVVKVDAFNVVAGFSLRLLTAIPKLCTRANATPASYGERVKFASAGNPAAMQLADHRENDDKNSLMIAVASHAGTREVP
jgi:hypothetical protein